MYYRKEMTATYYDCDVNNLLKPAAMMRYMQQTSSEQLSVLGQSVEHLYERGMVFLLSGSNIAVHRAPVCGERISVGTAATGTKGVRFFREFTVDTLEGERLVSCLSVWALVDTQCHKILRPNTYPHAIEWQEPGVDEQLYASLIPKEIPQDAQPRVVEQEIYYSHLDINSHVNNSMYADFACDALPFEELTKQGIGLLALSFQREARHGDVLKIERALISPGRYKVTGTNGAQPCFEAYVCMGGKSAI